MGFLQYEEVAVVVEEAEDNEDLQRRDDLDLPLVDRI